MVVEISKKELERALSVTSPFLNKRDETLITSHYLLRAVGEELLIEASDGSSGLSVKISDDVAIEGEGSTTADGKKFLSIVKGMNPNKSITLETGSDYLLVKQGRSRFKIKTMDGEREPFPAVSDRSKLTFSSTTLHSAIKKLLPAIDPNSPKYEITGGLIEVESGGVNFVSTDTKRLSVIREPITGVGTDELQLIIPKHSLSEIVKLFDGDIDLYYDQDMLIINSGDYHFYSRLISGTYPNYKRIVPTSSNISVDIPKKELSEALKLISNVNPEVKITIDGKVIEVESLVDGSSKAEAKTEFEISDEVAEPISFGLNSRYLLDFLSAIEDDRFNLSITEPIRPILAESKNFQLVIMPIQVGD
jgi:DNA polymerase-3 subunit beta